MQIQSQSLMMQDANVVSDNLGFRSISKRSYEQLIRVSKDILLQLDMDKQKAELQKIQRIHDVGATGVGWIIGFFCILFASFIYIESEPSPAVKNTKLFPLFESKKYHLLEKKIDSQNRVLLKGKEEEGLGIFIDQYINERHQLIKIKRRHYHVGKNLQFENSNVFTKSYHFVSKSIGSLLKNKEDQRILWVIQTSGGLDQKDIQSIHQFAQSHSSHKFLITAESAPAKATKYFKVIEYHELPKKMVSEHLFKNHKIDKVNALNLLNSFGGNLQRINEMIEDHDSQQKFIQSYQQQSQELNELLLTNNKQVKKFFDNLCKNGKIKSKKQFPFIPSDSGLVVYKDAEYHWRDIKAIFAFSDKYDVECKTDIDIVYTPGHQNDNLWFQQLFQYGQPKQKEAKVIQIQVKQSRQKKPNKQKKKQIPPKKKKNRK